jgi:hypothetical protein
MVMYEDGDDHGLGPPPDELDGPLRAAVDEMFGAPVPERAMRAAVERFAAIERPAAARPMRLPWLAPAALAAVAVLLFVVSPREDGSDGRSGRVVKPLAPGPAAAGPAQGDATLRTYHLAMQDSPEAMLALLERNATTFAPSSDPPLRARAVRLQDVLELEDEEPR